VPSTLDDLTVFRRGEPGYDGARAQVTWNRRLENARSPEAIVRCASAEDVATAVRFAGMNGLQVSPRGSGHHYGAAALREGGLMLDLGGLDFVEIDAQARTARVGAGVRGDALTARLGRHGLAFPVGHCADVGLSGYILAGGFGWNAGAWGAACANVTAMEMVTAAGEVVLASADSHPDLFWAARGHGAGFFAVVTAYHLRLHQQPPAVFAWRVILSAADVPALADWLTAATAAAHGTAEIGCFLLAHPESGEPAVILRVSACGESNAEARDKTAAFFSPPVSVEPLGGVKEEFLPFGELHRLSPMPDGKRVAADHAWCDAPLGALLGQCRAFLRRAVIRRSTSSPTAAIRASRSATARCRSAAEPARAFTRCGMIPPTTRPTRHGSIASMTRSPRSATVAMSARPTSRSPGHAAASASRQRCSRGSSGFASATIRTAVSPYRTCYAMR
jgi:hypothetical protein